MATVADVWRPTSELEHRLQETVRAGDQESYFRLIADSELLIPVPPDLVDGMLAGEAQPTWPTQEEDGRVHVLAYTSASAMRACLGPSYQHFMTVRFGEIAESWPDNRWWLAIDAPARGVAAALPIEARLPAWFVRQVAEGDGRPPQVGRAPAPWEELRDQHRELPREKPRQEFQPANDVERELLRAAANNDHDLFLQTLAATDVLLPVPDGTDYTMRPGRPGFPWQTREVDGSTVVPVFTSPERLVEAARAAGTGTEYIKLPFNVALRYWPDHDWPLAVNSGSPAGGTVLAQQLPGLAAWADQRAAQRRTDGFEPQNDVEGRLFEAARRRDTDGFFKILLGAQVLVPADPDTPWGIAPGEPGFPWRPVTVHGRRSIQVFTSLKWLNEAVGSSRFIMPTLLDMVAAWPDTDWDLVLNPGTPIDATMPGDKVRSLGGARAAERATPPAAAAPAPPDAPAVPVAPPVPDAAGRGGPGDAPGGPGAGSGTGPAAPDAPAEPVGADLPAERPRRGHRTPGPRPPAGPSGAPDAPPAPAQGPNPQQPVRASEPRLHGDGPAGRDSRASARRPSTRHPHRPPARPRVRKAIPAGGPAMPAPQASATPGPQPGARPAADAGRHVPRSVPRGGPAQACREGRTWPHPASRAAPGLRPCPAARLPSRPGGRTPTPDHGPAGMPEAFRHPRRAVVRVGVRPPGRLGRRAAGQGLRTSAARLAGCGHVLPSRQARAGPPRGTLRGTWRPASLAAHFSAGRMWRTPAVRPSPGRRPALCPCSGGPGGGAGAACSAAWPRPGCPARPVRRRRAGCARPHRLLRAAWAGASRASGAPDGPAGGCGPGVQWPRRRALGGEVRAHRLGRSVPRRGTRAASGARPARRVAGPPAAGGVRHRGRHGDGRGVPEARAPPRPGASRAPHPGRRRGSGPRRRASSPLRVVPGLRTRSQSVSGHAGDLDQQGRHDEAGRPDGLVQPLERRDFLDGPAAVRR